MSLVWRLLDEGAPLGLPAQDGKGEQQGVFGDLGSSHPPPVGHEPPFLNEGARDSATNAARKITDVPQSTVGRFQPDFGETGSGPAGQKNLGIFPNKIVEIKILAVFSQYQWICLAVAPPMNGEQVAFKWFDGGSDPDRQARGRSVYSGDGSDGGHFSNVTPHFFPGNTTVIYTGERGVPG